LAQDPPAGEEGAPAEGTPAEGTPAEGTEATPPADPSMDAAAAAGAATSLTNGAGKISIEGSTVNVNMSADAVAKPFSLAPSVRYGVNEKITVGVTHDLGTTKYSPRPVPGAGICLAGKENGCAKVYDNIGLDVLFGAVQGKTSVAIHGGLEVLSFDPLLLDIRAGALIKFDANEKISVVADPWILVGLTERDAGNKELLNVPVYVWFNANEKISVYGATGIYGPLDGFGDAYGIPLGLGGNFAANEKLTVGADFWFENIAGKGSSADFRSLALRVGYAL
jgi:hypothetical protein